MPGLHVIATLLLLATGPLARAAAPADAAGATMPAETSDGFCAAAQRLAAGTQLPARNVVHANYEAFVESKPAIRPLVTQQYVLRDDAGRPLRVSCKLKTADHLRAEYGRAAAAEDSARCAALNREVARSVYARLDAATRARAVFPLARVFLEPDEITFVGSRYVAPYPFVWIADDGTLRLRAKSLRVDWDDWRFAWAPDRVRGTHYCHLVAPEYLRRLMLGEARPPTGSSG